MAEFSGRGRLLARQALSEILYRLGIRQANPHSLSVLMYHAVTKQALRDPAQQSIPVDLFDAQMGALREMGFSIVPLEEGMQRLRRKENGGPWCSVAFDDGYAGVYENGFEVLRRHRIPSTLFLSTNFIGREQFPWSGAALGRPLRWNEINALIQEAGCSIGSHSHSHPVLTRLNAEAIRQEIVLSRERILAETGVRPRLFAYPYGFFGSFNKTTGRILSEEGFSIACTAVWGRQTPQGDWMSVKRIRVSWCDSIHEVRKSLAGCGDWYRWLQNWQARYNQGFRSLQATA